MIYEYQNLTNDILIDKIIQRADELTTQNGNIVDELTYKELEQQLKMEGADNEERI